MNPDPLMLFDAIMMLQRTERVGIVTTKNRFDALMRRIGWGTIVTLVILLIIIKLLWNML